MNDTQKNKMIENTNEKYEKKKKMDQIKLYKKSKYNEQIINNHVKIKDKNK